MHPNKITTDFLATAVQLISSLQPPGPIRAKSDNRYAHTPTILPIVFFFCSSPLKIYTFDSWQILLHVELVLRARNVCWRWSRLFVFVLNREFHCCNISTPDDWLPMQRTICHCLIYVSCKLCVGALLLCFTNYD